MREGSQTDLLKTIVKGEKVFPIDNYKGRQKNASGEVAPPARDRAGKRGREGIEVGVRYQKREGLGKGRKCNKSGHRTMQAWVPEWGTKLEGQ